MPNRGRGLARHSCSKRKASRRLEVGVAVSTHVDEASVGAVYVQVGLAGSSELEELLL